MDETQGGISRRDAIKRTAKVAGAAAFAAPVVVGVFSSPAAAAPLCSAATDSDIVTANVPNVDWNTNQGAGCEFGRYNGQNQNFTITGISGTGTIQVGSGGVDNFCSNVSYYIATFNSTWVCSVTWMVTNCNGSIVPSIPVNPPANAQPIVYCTNPSSNSRLVLQNIVCCPSPR